MFANPTHNRKFSKNCEKTQKIINHNHSLFSSPNRLGKVEKERKKKKKIVPMCSYPTRNRKFQKNCKKIHEIRKKHHSFFSSQNRMGKAENERKLLKRKKIVPTCFYSTRNRKFQKNIRKIKILENIIIASFQGKIG